MNNVMKVVSGCRRQDTLASRASTLEECIQRGKPLCCFPAWKEPPAAAAAAAAEAAAAPPPSPPTPAAPQDAGVQRRRQAAAQHVLGAAAVADASQGDGVEREAPPASVALLPADAQACW